ncbi:MAG TPA: flagellar hook-length control protein FliK [Thiopseudomonas sp.]|nr:flagellar hook-length control protein FliK [Thiopseudomonas sp.]
MATTDFLLQSSTPSKRVQPAMQDKVANQRSATPAPAQSFSSVYAQQRSTHASQQQAQQAKQRDAVLEQNQQQAARHTTSKSAAQPTKDKTVAPNKEPVSSERVETESYQSASDAEVKQTDAVPSQVQTVQTEKPEQDLLDPLLLMAMTVMPTNYAAEADVDLEPELEVEALLNDSAVGLELVSTDAIASDQDKLAAVTDESVIEGFESVQGFAVTEAGNSKVTTVPSATQQFSLDGEQEPSDTDKLQFKADATNTSASKSVKDDMTSDSDKSALLGTSSAKSFDAFIEKSHADKNSSEVLPETLKAAPETLLNNKAVTPADTIRADLQSRAEPLLTAQSVRQVPGAAMSMQQPGWTQEVTDKVMWMSSQNLRSADIKLDPAELGRLDIKVDITQDHTQISFSSANASVRESLESQMYRLREMFNQQGMQNVDVNVSDQSSREQSDTQAQAASQGRSGTSTDNTEETQQHVTSIREQHDGRLGLVDYYA